MASPLAGGEEAGPLPPACAEAGGISGPVKNGKNLLSMMPVYHSRLLDARQAADRAGLKKELLFANFRVDKLESAYYNKAMS